MKKLMISIVLTILCIASASAQSGQAHISFENKSAYTMTLKIMYATGGLYNIVSLPPHSSRTVYFSKTNTFRLKIKAVKGMFTSYHDGGDFSVTCNSREYTTGSMTFMMSEYGTGLGPTISAKEFESDY